MRSTFKLGLGAASEIYQQLFIFPLVIAILASCSSSPDFPSNGSETSGPPAGSGGGTTGPTGGTTGSGGCANGGSTSSETGTIVCNSTSVGGDGGYIGTPASLSVSPAGFNFQVQSINSLNYATFTVSNTGESTATNLAATGLSGAYAFQNGNYPGYLGTCGNTLNPLSSCTVVVSFNPTSLGQFNLSSFMINSDQSSVNVPLEGTASDIATLEFTDLVDTNNYWNYGTIAWGTVVTEDIHVDYWGTLPATGVAFSGITPPFAIVSNTCGTTVSAGCDLVISYTGNVAGATSQNLKVSYNNGSYAADATFIVEGTTSAQVLPATLTLAGQNYGLELVGSSTNAVISVVKGGTLPATGVSFSLGSGPFQFKGGAGFPGTGGTCSTTITANCTLVVVYSPTAAGSFSSTLSASFNNGQTSAQASSTIAGQAGGTAVVTLSPNTNPVNFGSTPINLAKTLNFTLSNTAGSVTATAITINVSSGAFAYTGGCGQSLSPGASCTFSIRFLPTTAGILTASLTVGYFNGSQTQSGIGTTLSGVGTSNASLALSVNSYNFGGVAIGSNKTASLAINYYGSLPATVESTSGITAPFTFSGGSFSDSGTCGNTISASCNVSITFTPTAVTTYTTTFSITYNDGTGTTQTISIVLTGNGIQYTASVLTFAQTPPINFGNVAVNSYLTTTLTLNKTGNSNATQVTGSGISSPFSFYGGSFPGTGGNCSSTISASSCTIVIAFAPVAAGSAAQTLQISYYDGFQNQQISLSLEGVGVNLALLTASSGTFTSAPFPNTNTLNLTISNHGTRQTDSFVLATSPSAPFSVLSNGCSSQIAAGASCLVQLVLSPTVPGQFTSSLGYNYLNGLSQQVLTASLSGASTVAPFVSVNGNFSCGRNTYGQLKCWGENNYGQLGQGDTVQRGDGTSPPLTSLAPINLGTGHYAVAVTTGFFHACALLENNTLKCWGENLYGQLGLGVSTTSIGSAAGQMGDSLPVINLGTGKYATAISAGYAFTCAILNDGGVKCWGQNESGQLGQGSTANIGLNATDMGDNLAEINLGGLSALQISTGTNHACAILHGQSVRCWGDNFYGELGQGDTVDRGIAPSDMQNLASINIGSGDTAVSVGAGGAFTCVILSTGAVECWGRNQYGILGNLYAQNSDGDVGPASNPDYPLALGGIGVGPNQMGNNLIPILLGTGRTATAISTADSSICATLDNATVKCWGENQYGQLGQGNTTNIGVTGSDMGDALEPVSFGTGITPVIISSGNFHNCASFNNAEIKCWGYNNYGNLGLGNTTNYGSAANQMGDDLPLVSF